MNLVEFAEMIEDGVHPVIEVLDTIDDCYADKGMRARIIGVEDDSWRWEKEDRFEVIKGFKLDYSEFDEYNKQFEAANWYNSKTGLYDQTARESGHYNVNEVIFISAHRELTKPNGELKEDRLDATFKIVEDTKLKLYDAYKQALKQVPNQTYVEFLEDIAINNAFQHLR